MECTKSSIQRQLYGDKHLCAEKKILISLYILQKQRKNKQPEFSRKKKGGLYVWSNKVKMKPRDIKEDKE
jgi:hypothetical protein